jgi:hypothetical protein
MAAASAQTIKPKYMAIIPGKERERIQSGASGLTARPMNRVTPTIEPLVRKAAAATLRTSKSFE